jgi:hypothetical protein
MGLLAVRTDKSRGGRRTVTYRDANGKTWDALVLGEGTNSGVMLELVSMRGPRADRIRDDVPLGTDVKDTEVYFRRWGQ